MKNSNTPPSLKDHNKNNNNNSQKLTFLTYLKKQVATASMVSNATGIPQKNITRYKRELEKQNQLWEVCKRYCQITGFRAAYLTTDPNKAPQNNQLKLPLK